VSKKVLVVDDDAMIRDMLAAMLRHAGYEPILADSGQRALALYREHAPHVTFVDIVMPGMNGMELAVAIKADYPKAHLIALSGHSADSFEQDWRDVGFDDFLKKPILMSTLLSAAKAAFSQTESPQ